jgi:hypothetical protein
LAAASRKSPASSLIEINREGIRQTGRGRHGLHSIEMRSSPNRAVGGATRSKHLDGAAFDIAMSNHDPEAFEGEAPVIGGLLAAVAGSAWARIALRCGVSGEDTQIV